MVRRIALLVAVIALLAACSPAQPKATPPAPPKPPTSTTPPLPPATVTPDPGQVATLTGLLQDMRQHFPALTLIPGAQDILDYGIGDLWRKGVDGAGTTVALVEGWNAPDIGPALAAFDRRMGLPDPDLQTIYPAGPLPPQCPAGMVSLGSYGSCDGWAGELELDVASVHLIAPYAKILLVVTPPDTETTDDAASQVAPPEMMEGVEYVATHHLADVISISDDTGEATFSHGAPQITAQDPGELTAAANDIPVLVGTGDCGVVQNLATASSQCGSTTKTPDTAAWDDSPWVTAVGGSVPNLNHTTGASLGPDTVWAEGKSAEGAGTSTVYRVPEYQRHVVNGPMRAVPDLTMDGMAGTSESTPLFAGVLALAAQLNHAPVGPINNVLYQVLGPKGTQDGISDIVTGSNSVPGAPGLSAGPGFDPATGWGTINAATFVPALIDAVRAQHAPNIPSLQAAAALAKLRGGAHLTGDARRLVSTGFLPGHPVHLLIDGKQVTTLTADDTGAIGYPVDPATLHLAPGRHTMVLHSMLIDQQLSFTSK
ncbi:MAG TPA: S53 family peptidase [Pseudonocardiaceae bacterium]|nr:S53 family peptidase [Pseudonocardiaceae bacterium]